MSIPFTYRIYHKPTKTHYYGCRYAKNCHPNDLFQTYFTSSRLIKELINHFGIDSFEIKRIKKFNTKKEALNWEYKFLTRIDASNRENWINKHNGGVYDFKQTKTKEHRKKISIAKLGHKQSLETIEKRVSKLRGRPSKLRNRNIHTTISKEKISNSLKLSYNSGQRIATMKGKTHSEETKNKMKLSHYRPIPDDFYSNINLGIRKLMKMYKAHCFTIKRWILETH